MKPDFPDAYRDRLRWAIDEGLLIAGIFGFWLVLGFLVLTALGVLAFVIQTLRISQLRFVYDVLRWDAVLWSGVMTLANATVGLYILVRAGTILIDRYRTGTRS
jgi:hypothetical protein